MELLEQYHIIHSYLGLFHVITAIAAMLFGALVLLNEKGTARHKKLGYVYVVSMLLLNISALGIYNFGTFNLFHGFAILSLFSIVMGMNAAIRRKSEEWLAYHFYFMNWSVVGLYCAFWAEVGVRFFDMRYFWWVVMLATMLTAFIGWFLIERKAEELKFK